MHVYSLIHLIAVCLSRAVNVVVPCVFLSLQNLSSNVSPAEVSDTQQPVSVRLL